jgi:polyhydroxybutyrate depolymerase
MRKNMVSLAAVALAAVGTLVGGGVATAAPTPDVAPVSSPGCSAPAAAPGLSRQVYGDGNRSGNYLQTVPTAAPATPMPVVIDLHGYLEPAELEFLSNGLAQFGERNGFVTITPQMDRGGLPLWDFGPNSADIAYLGNLLTHVERTTCVDERRVYVAGLSMGAFTTSSVACQLADRIAAVAPVAGLQDFAWCKPSRPVPVVAFHGAADQIVAYTGGIGGIGKLLPGPDGAQKNPDPNAAGMPSPRTIPDQVAGWARRNGCAPVAVDTRVGADVTRSAYPCPAGAEVEFYTIADGGHTWPGEPALVMPEFIVGRTTTAISANQVMWDFFRAHPLPGTVNP